jgi:hypothetical protein
MKRVEVEWEDSCLINGWMNLDNILLTGRPQATHIGYLVAEDEHSITLVMGHSNSGLYHARFTIPRGAIKFMKELRVR